MSTIKSLPFSTVKLLKSSQVILSVSSLVKELIENALDAGATIISVKLENGGLQKIEVRDNGCGLSPEDVQVMAQPHYTSKIQNHDDLQQLSTYGFRGEALAAICCVSTFSVVTKREQDEFSTSYVMNPNGEVKEQKISNLGTGTSVVVENLFKNLPVRRKQFQDPKHSKRELKLVEDLLLAYTIIHPTLYATLHHNRHLIWQKPRTSTLKDSLAHHFSRSLVQHLAFLHNKAPDVTIELCFPVPSAPIELCFRQKPDRFFLFVNNRPVVDKEFVEVVKEAYRSQGAFNDSLFPIGTLSIQVSSACLDVNLEPNKTRVLFSNKDVVKDLIKTTLLEHWKAAVLPKEPEVRVDSILHENERMIVQIEQTPVTKTFKNAVSVPQFHELDFQKRTLVNTNMLASNSLQPATFVHRDENRNVQTKPTLVNESVTDAAEIDFQKRAGLDTHLVLSNAPQPAALVRENPNALTLREPGRAIMNTHLPSNALQPATLLRENSKALLVSELGLRSFPAKRGPEDLDSWTRGNVMTNGKPLNPVGLLRGSPFGKINESFAPKPKRSKLSLYPSQPKLDVFLRDRRQNHRTEVIHPSTKDCRNLDITESAVEKTLMDYFSRNEKSVAQPVAERGQVPTKSPTVKGNAPKTLQGPKRFERNMGSRKTVSIDFSLSSFNSELKEQQDHVTNRVVGQVEGFWVVYRNQNLTIWNHHRLQEIILYRHLVAQWDVPSKEPIDFRVIDANLLGFELWSVLLSLESELDSDTTSSITDKRLISNGYCLQIADGSTSYATALNIPAYISSHEVDDLKEILQNISRNPLCNLEESRTQAGKECCQMEAYRLSQTPEASCNEGSDFLELLEAYLELRAEVSSQLSRCFHDKEVEFKLCSPDSLPDGQ